MPRRSRKQIERRSLAECFYLACDLSVDEKRQVSQHHLPSDLLSQVSHNVWRTDGESPIKHSKQKYKRITLVARVVLPFAPYEGVCGMLSMHHAGNDSDQNTDNNQNTIQSCKFWQ